MSHYVQKVLFTWTSAVDRKNEIVILE